MKRVAKSNESRRVSLLLDPSTSDVSPWDVSNVTNMRATFSNEMNYDPDGMRAVDATPAKKHGCHL